MAPPFTVVRGGRVLDAPGHRAPAADVLIEGDTIRAVGAPGLPAPADAVVVEATDRLLMPGLVNAHTHAHGTLGKGLMGDRWPLELLLNMNPSVVGNRTVEEKYLSALLAAVEMVRRGCTACYDLFLEVPTPTVEGLHAVGRAYADVGMRAVVAPMLADLTLYEALPGLLDAFPGALRDEVARIRLAPYPASLDPVRAALRRWPFDRMQVRPALAPTIPLHCTDDFLRACGDVAREHDVGLHTHLAESRVQASAGVRRYGRSLTAHLDALGLLGPRFTAAHAIWVDADDVQRLADRGASVVHNPLSNLRFGSGLARVRAMLERGVNVGVGTDAANSADSLNMFEATRLASYISRVVTPDTGGWLRADEALTMATAGSAAAMGFGETLGRVAPGYKADLVFLDLGHIHYLPLHDPTSQLVNGESGAAVHSVMIGGRLVLDAGRLLTVDEAALRRQVEAAAERLQAVSAPAVDLARRLQPVVAAFCAGQTPG